jgi:hypothetical protein
MVSRSDIPSREKSAPWCCNHGSERAIVGTATNLELLQLIERSQDDVTKENH